MCNVSLSFFLVSRVNNFNFIVFLGGNTLTAFSKKKIDKIRSEIDFKILKKGISTELYKWDKVEKDFKEKKEMDPIKVKRFKDTRYYNIIDGRHRCMLSLFFEYTHIPANILD